MLFISKKQCESSTDTIDMRLSVPAEGVHLTLPPHVFFRPSKITKHATSRASLEQNRRNLTLTLTLTLNVLLPSIVFHNKI